MKPSRRRALFWATSLAAILYTGTATWTVATTAAFSGDKRGGLPVPESSILNMPAAYGLSAREYLDLANSIAHQHDTAGDGACKELVDATYDIYHELVELDRRHDLGTQVRLASSALGDGEVHIWIQVSESGRWRDYETLYVPPALSPATVRAYSRATASMRETFESEESRDFTSIPGTSIMLPGPHMLRPGSSAAILYKYLIGRDWKDS